MVFMTLSVLLIAGVAWGLNMFRRKTSLAELFAYVAYWAFGAWILPSLGRHAMF
jgi:hypothetical protein